jgi:hypothetical protein
MYTFCSYTYNAYNNICRASAYLSAKKDQKFRALPQRAVESTTCTSSCIYCAKNVAGACCSTRTNSRIARVRRLEILSFISSVGSFPSTLNVIVVHICNSSNKASNERRIPRLVTASTPSASFSSMMSLK